MAIQKYYITWQRLWVGKNVGTDISANVNNNWNYDGHPITCTELPYGYVDADKRLLAIIEYDDTYYDSEAIKRLTDSLLPWAYTEINANKALSLCNEWYPAPEGEADYFTLDTDGFTLIDNRPVEEI